MSVRGTSDGVVAMKISERAPPADTSANCAVAASVAFANCELAVSEPVPHPSVHCTFARPAESVTAVGGITVPDKVASLTDQSTIAPGKPTPDASTTLAMRGSGRDWPRIPTCPSPAMLRRLRTTGGVTGGVTGGGAAPVGDSAPHAAATSGNAHHQSDARCLT